MSKSEGPKLRLLSTITVAAALWVGSSTGAPALEQEANAIYTGGDIITINDSQPTAEAIAVKDGKIPAVGTRADVLKRVPPPKWLIWAARRSCPNS